MSRILKSIFLLVGLCVFASRSRADIIPIGTLSYDTFIPAGPGSPGIDAFDLSNLTGGFDLPPDFPISDSLIFESSILTLTLDDLSQEVFTLGDISAGFLLDVGGNPVVQVPGDQVFDSAEFRAELSPASFLLSDGTTFTASSTSLDVFLLPSSGPTLLPDLDLTTIGVSGTVGTATPEPSSRDLSLLCLPWLAWRLRRKSA